MTAISMCPDEHELLPVATGDPVGEAIEQHLDACPICAGHVELLRAELTAPRHDLGDAVKPASAEPDPAVAREGEPSGGETTFSRPSGPAGDAAPEPIGPEAVAAARAAPRAGPNGPAPSASTWSSACSARAARGRSSASSTRGSARTWCSKLARRPIGDDGRSDRLVGRGPAAGRAGPPQPGAGLRPRLPRRPPVPGHGVRPRPQPRAVRPRRAGRRRAGPRRWWPSWRGWSAMVHGRGIVHQDIKPREHPDRRSRAAAADRLRPGPAAPRLVRPAVDHLGRHARVHGPRAGPAELDRIGPPQRHLRPGWRALLPADRPGRRSRGRARTRSGTAPGGATSRPVALRPPGSRGGWSGSA